LKRHQAFRDDCGGIFDLSEEGPYEHVGFDRNKLWAYGKFLQERGFYRPQRPRFRWRENCLGCLLFAPVVACFGFALYCIVGYVLVSLRRGGP
jgi:hypothetical protein